MNKNRYTIGKAYINITNPEHTQQCILDAVEKGVNGYICVSNMRTIAIANKDEAYCKVMKNSYMNIPDGMPLVWCGRLWGCKDANRSSGPDLFIKMMANENSKLKFFLLGEDGISMLDSKTNIK